MSSSEDLWRFESYYEPPVAGADEAGRGALAGPVVAAVVVLQEGVADGRIADSKSLSPELRTELALWIRQNALAYGLGVASHKEVDEHNVLQATGIAMSRAYNTLNPKPSVLLLDGHYVWKRFRNANAKPIVKGDSKSYSIAAASILAKVERDRLMQRLHLQYPQYGFDKNKGYGVPGHLKGLEQFGPCGIHRRSFAPVRRFSPLLRSAESQASMAKRN